MDPFCIMSDTQITSPTSFCIMSDTLGLVICVSAIIQNDNMLDSWSVYLTLYRMMLDLWSVYLTLYRMDPCWTRDLYLTLYLMTQCWTRDLCIWHYTEWCWTCDLYIWHLQNDTTRSRVQHVFILYNGRYTDHKSNMDPFCIMSDAQIMSPTWRHSVKFQIHRSRVQHEAILYNVRYTDHESKMASFCIMSDTQITSPTWCHSVNVRYTDHKSNIISV